MPELWDYGRCKGEEGVSGEMGKGERRKKGRKRRECRKGEKMLFIMLSNLFSNLFYTSPASGHKLLLAVVAV
jgi:hypothetical protein